MAVILIVFGAVILGLIGVLIFAGTRGSQVLPPNVVDELASLTPRRPNQHEVDLQLADGRLIRKAYVAYGRYLVRSPGRLLPTNRFKAADVVHVVERRPDGDAAS